MSVGQLPGLRKPDYENGGSERVALPEHHLSGSGLLIVTIIAKLSLNSTQLQLQL